MPRIDLRVKIPIRAEIITTSSAGKEKRCPVTVSNIGLGGALIEGEMDGINEQTRFSLLIGDHSDLEFPARVLWRDEGKSRLFFFYEEKAAVEALWAQIKKEIGQLEKGICPYCGGSTTEDLDECGRCHLSLNFSDGYVDKHTRRTFLERLDRRSKEMTDQEHFHLLQIVDREILRNDDEHVVEEYVGTCPQMLTVFSLIRKIAPTDIPVLLLGESGTGKELAARAVHERSMRPSTQYLILNCAAIPETLLEAELFGYERGAFTGAYQTRKGKFEVADGGTLFLDEIGEMPATLQAKLLRFLEDKSFERIGSQKSRKVDARIIAATNRDLERDVMEGQFRQDLFYRLNAFPIRLPPLRERGEDKLLLAKYFLKKFRLESSVSSGRKRFSEGALVAISVYEWPGNVRELINRIRKGIVISDGEEITAENLDLGQILVPKRDNGQSLEDIRSATEKSKMIEMIHACGGNLSRVARELRISRTTMYKLKKKYQI
ncbi:MAG: sigma-54-dependent Fis family transcriptional regulator [Deltaproteobacteria bacterium]|nr:sigma-54-dependent Fis family transcriptional regulator [Deltaproteobacteria bacterium]